MRKVHTIVGIDPGITGALAFVRRHMGDLSGPPLGIDLEDMPIIVASGKGAKHEISGAQLADLLRRQQPMQAYIERVHAMPGQGVSACFSFGQSQGIIRGVLESLRIPYSFISPEAWKKKFSLNGSEKDAARGRAIQLFPGIASDLARKKDIGRADALLIAQCGHQRALM